MSALDALVRRGVVRIGRGGEGYHGQSAAFWGSGFFVAPGWVLSCAHVLSKGADAVWKGGGDICVTAEGDVPLTGELAVGLPAPRASGGSVRAHWPLPDLALVRVPEATDPDCLWLSDRSAVTLAEVGLYGWIPAPEGVPLPFSGAGTATGTGCGPFMLSGGPLRHGASGGPVIDLKSGAVIGVSKSRDRGGEAGMAVPVTSLRPLRGAGDRAERLVDEVLRAHDRHHERRYVAFGESWPRHQVRLDQRAYGFTPDHRTPLYALLAELPPPGSSGQVLEVVNDARRLVLRSAYPMDVHQPHAWREGAGLLYGSHDGRSPGPDAADELELEAVVLYAAKVYATLAAHGGAPALEELRAWVTSAAVALRNDVVRAEIPGILDGARRPATARADVLIEIDADVYGTHAWRVKLWQEDGEITPVRHNEVGVPRDQLESDIRDALAAALERADLGEHLAAVNVEVPGALFDEPVDEWRAREPGPGEPFSPHTLPIGHRRVVVLRDKERASQPVTPEWRARWQGAERGPLQAVPLRGGVPQDGHAARPEGNGAAYARLSGAPAGAVPVHCARTGSGPGAAAVTVALAAGHAVLLWRRCEEEHPDCAEFYEGAAALLAQADTALALPEHVRTLRNQNADTEPARPEAAWARHIVLIYDPPDRPPLPAGPLRAPPLRPGRPS